MPLLWQLDAVDIDREDEIDSRMWIIINEDTNYLCSMVRFDRDKYLNEYNTSIKIWNLLPTQVLIDIITIQPFREHNSKIFKVYKAIAIYITS